MATLAHAGGGDEIALFVLLPALIFLAIFYASRRRGKGEDEDGAPRSSRRRTRT